MPDLLVAAEVAPSGMGVLFTFRDPATGALAPLSSLSDQREVQSLTLAPGATGAPSTLSLGGATTAPIARVFAPPPVFAQWSATVPAPGSYELAVNLPNFASYRSAALLHEVFGGDPAVPGSLVGTATINLVSSAGNPVAFRDGSVDRGGGPVDWMPLGPFAVPGTTLIVRASGPDPAVHPGDPGALLYAGSLRVRPASGGTTRVVGPDEPPGSSASTLGPGYLQYQAQPYDLPGAPGRQHVVKGAGGYPTLDPAAVQAALEALPGGSGNYSCSGSGTGADPVIVRFVGSFGQAALPLLASSDPALVVARVAAGGNWPSISVDGGPAIPLGPLCNYAPIWGTGHGDPDHPTARTNPPYLPAAYFPFLQAAPALRREKVLSHLNATVGSWMPSPRAGYADIPQATTTPGDHAAFRREGLPASTFRVSLTWTPHASNTADALLTVTNRTGATLAAWHFDQRAAPSGAADDGVPWQVGGAVTTTAFVDDVVATLTNAAGSGVLVADAVRFERTSADNSLVIAPGSVVTYSAGPGWAASASGGAPAASSVTVANRSGGTLYPAIPGGPKSMGVGYNVNETFAIAPVMRFNNLAFNYQEPGNVLARDSDGYPTRFSGNSAAPTDALACPLASPPGAVAGDGRGWPNVAPGRFTAFWDGSSDVTVDGTEDVSRALFSGTTGHRRVFAVPAPGGQYAPNVIVRLHSASKNPDNTFNLDIRNLRVYPGDLDVDPASKFTPGILAKLTGCSSTRFLNPLQAIAGNAHDFSDYNPPATSLTRFGNRRVFSARIAEVRAGSGFWRPDSGIIFRATTTAPHGLNEGDFVTFPTSPGTATLSGGGTFDLANPGTVHVLSATQFSYQGGLGSTPPVTMTNVVGDVGGAVLCRAGNNDRLGDLVDLCNEAGTDFYLNTTLGASDDCLVAIGGYLAAHLAPTLKVRAEPINEPWNSGFYAFHYMTAASYDAGLGDGWVPYYCRLAARQWRLLRQGWAAGGRAPGDLLRVAGSQWSSPGVTDGLAARFAADGTAFDRLALAPYTGIAPSPASGGGQEPGLLDVGDLLVTPQDLDLFEMYYTRSGYDRMNPLHRAALDLHGFTGVGLMAYEGGPSGEVPYFAAGVRLPSRMAERSHACHRHPRRLGLMLHQLRQEQDTGMAGPYHLYLLAALGDQLIGGTLAMWSAWQGTGQLAGTGDPAADADNIDSPDRMDLLRSEVGGAVARWQSAIGAGGTPPPVPPPPPIPPHVLRRVHRGRSLSRRR